MSFFNLTLRHIKANFFLHMKIKAYLYFILSLTLVIACSGNKDYSPEHIAETSGRYLYNADDIIEVFYESNTLFLKWRGMDKIEPLALDQNTFFVEQLYEKLQFVQHPQTKQRYLSVVSKDKEDEITYDFIKVTDSFMTPSMYLKKFDYDKALAGYLSIQEKDSNSILLNERDFNALGYKFLNKEKYNDAIEVFKINTVLFPKSTNVFDSLGEGYLKSGDSLLAYENYRKALKIDNGNRRAKRYVDAFESK